MKIGEMLRSYMPYMEKFGIINGRRIAQTLFPKTPSKDTVSVKIPQALYPINVRLGTTDVANFHENFLMAEFILPDNLHPKLIIDAGANVGFASIFFLNKYPQSQVIAVEPEGSNIEILNKNCSVYSNFKSIQSAIWKTDGYLKISNKSAGNTAFQVIETTYSDPEAFPAITFEKILENSKFDKIDILKIDIEGAEKEIFEDNYKKWIDKVDVLIIELHDRFKPGCALSFYSAIEKHDFIQFSKGENLVYVRMK